MNTINLTRSKGSSLVSILVVMAVIVILMSIGTGGILWVKSQAATTALVGRATDIGHALQLYYLDNRGYPSACPSTLEQSLAAYVDDPSVFANLGPAAGADEINKTYVMPNDADPNSYVLSLEPPKDPTRVVVLFADWTVEVADRLPITFNDVAVEPGTTVTGGTITFASESTVQVPPTVSVTIVQSFRTADGTPFDVVKCNPGSYGTMNVTAQGADVLTVATEAGPVLMRQAVADIKLEPVEPHDRVAVTSYQGEVIFCSTEVDRGSAPGYNGLPPEPAAPSGPGSTPSTAQTISGTTFQDLTGEGLSSDDPPMSGVTLKLYRDKNNDGALTSADGSPVATAVTAPTTGAYVFANLTAARYFVKEIVPSGYVRTSPELSDTQTVVITTSQSATGVNFANFLKPSWTGRVTNLTFLINGTTSVTDLRGNTNQGDLVQVGFTITAGPPVELSLVSYIAPDRLFVAGNAGSQFVFDSCTGDFPPGTYSLWVENPDFWVENPDCYFQIDFVCGPIICHFGPANSNIFYSAQGRLISADNDGLTAPAPYVPEQLGGSANQNPTGYRTLSRGIPVPKGYRITAMKR